MIAMPWARRARRDRVAFSMHDGAFAFVQAEGTRIVRCGLELRGGDDDAAFARRVRALGLPASPAVALLPLSACQLLQVDAPAVPREELKAAARWKVKDLVDAHLDDLCIDVMHVGDARPKVKDQIFVAAASTREVRALAQWSETARLDLAVIEIPENAQRNLQTAAARRHAAGHAERADRAGRADAASAALVVHGSSCLLTMAARGELFHARRLEWHPQDLAARPAKAPADAVAAIAEVADLDIVDYGADDAGWTDSPVDVAPIVLEMQRSIDVWDRSWPDLPLERMVVQAQEHTATLVALLAGTLPTPVEALDIDALFPGFAATCASARVREAVTPLLGALLRDGGT